MVDTLGVMSELSLIKNEQPLQQLLQFEEMHFVSTFKDRVYKEKHYACVVCFSPF